MARKRRPQGPAAVPEVPASQEPGTAANAAPPEAAVPAPGVKKNGPAHQIVFAGRIKAVIWKNDGTHGPWYSVTIGRMYKDEKSGTFKTAGSFGRDDLLVAAKALEEAWFWVNAQNHNASSPENATAPTSDEPIPF